MIADIVTFLLVFFTGLKIADIFDVSSRDKRILRWLWGYHLFFGIFFWAYIAYGPGGDAYGYWVTARQMYWWELLPMIWNHPTFFTVFLCYFPANVLGLSFFATSMLFCLLGYTGISLFYVLYERMVPYNSHVGAVAIFPAIFFLPNLHFWSAGVGKDTLLFFCIALFLFSMGKPLKRLPGLVLSLVLSYFVRPHVTLFLIAAFALGFFLDGKLKAYQKILIVTLFFAGILLIFDNMAAYLKISDLSPESIDSFTQVRASNLSRANVTTAIDIASYPLPLKWFTFLYRPLFFDARSIVLLMSSFENLILLILTIRMLAARPAAAFIRANYTVKGAAVFVIIGVLASSMIMSNLGIILRQKNMFVPAMLLFIGWTLALKDPRARTNPAVQIPPE